MSEGHLASAADSPPPGAITLKALRHIVDAAGPGILDCENDPAKLYAYVGLAYGSSFQTTSVSDALYDKIKASFTAGHLRAWRVCASLRKDLIREHVLDGVVLDPYFAVLDRLQDAVRSDSDPSADIDGDWETAIRAALDVTVLLNWGEIQRDRLHARDFYVARAAKALREAGFGIRQVPGWIGFTRDGEHAVIKVIEDLIASMGGLNVARRIFDAIAPKYDATQQRYHLVRQASTSGGGTPQVPWGYLLQLAVKHIQGRKPYDNSDAKWTALVQLSQAFAAVIDVQPYHPPIYVQMDATALVPYLIEMALYDTLFLIPQMRPSDVTRLARGALDWLDPKDASNRGWTIDQVVEVIDYVLDPARGLRGPVVIDIAAVRRGCPTIAPDTVDLVLDAVLAHPHTGANQSFSHPTDAPLRDPGGVPERGHDFGQRPILKLPGSKLLLVDRSVCAPACIEALFTALRAEDKGLDDKVGKSVERFLEAQFVARGAPVLAGDYDVPGRHAECDLVVETAETVMFIELKKKALTRRARAGTDADILLDLAGSLLDAHVQTGWHEINLRREEHLELVRDGQTAQLNRSNRDIERLAVSLLDFGGYQDRILLKQFLEGTLNAAFTPTLPALNKKFERINDALAIMRDQMAILHPTPEERRMPFFNCWFLSVPQILVLLDGVTDAEGFRAALWNCKFMVTGQGDLYADLAYMQRLKRDAAATPKGVG